MSKTAVYSLRIGDLHHHSTELRKRLETLPSHLYSVPCSDTAYISFGGSITNVLSKRNDIMKLCPIEVSF
jgi:hypothetical protein